MTVWTAPNYLQDGARTVAEMKTAVEQNLAATKELLGGLPVTSITMSGTSITPAAGVSPFLSVATPGGAATANLTNCVPTNMKDGTWLALRMANAGQVVVVKHAAGGAGQFALAGTADLSLTDPSVILLAALSGTTWTEIGRFYGAQRTAFQSFYQTATLGQNRFTGRQEFNVGTTVTAAATLPIDATGNFFNVLGDTTITGMPLAPAGTVVTLYFNGSPVLVHSASFYLGGYNIQAKPGMMLEFVATPGGAGWLLKTGGLGGTAVLDRAVTSLNVVNSNVAVPIYDAIIPAGTLATLGSHVRSTVHGFLGAQDSGPLGPGQPFTVHFVLQAFLAGSVVTLANIIAAQGNVGGPIVGIPYGTGLVIHMDAFNKDGGGGIGVSLSPVVQCQAMFGATIVGSVVGGGGYGEIAVNPAVDLHFGLSAQFEFAGPNNTYWRTAGFTVRE
jgi:hypothetical protein